MLATRTERDPSSLAVLLFSRQRTISLSASDMGPVGSARSRGERERRARGLLEKERMEKARERAVVDALFGFFSFTFCSSTDL